MSHFSVLVIIEAIDDGDAKDLSEALDVLEEMLEPYKETRFNPISKWDYWMLGNGWVGELICKDGAIEKELAKRGKDSWVNEGIAFAPNHVDICRFDMLDLQAMQQKADSASGFKVYAFVDSENWHEKGRVGWFGTSTNEIAPEEWENILKERVQKIQPNDWVAIVDCHI